MFVVSITYKVNLEQVESHLDDHIAYLDRQYELGHFLVSGRKVPRTGGVILALAQSREMLDAVLVEDPFYQHALADYDVTEFVPTKSSQELALLLNR